MSNPLATTRRPLAQVVFCLGCCCGRTDRGHPEVPVERLKAAWKGEKLNRSVQLTISGCLGPCDLANVALVITPEGNLWLGGLAGDDPYDALTDWARESHRRGKLVPLPESLLSHRFDRFGPPRTVGGESDAPDV
jgi:cobaltochelatase CobN